MKKINTLLGPAMTFKLILGVAGLLAGAFTGGILDFLMTLVFPHGGWEHVSSDAVIDLLVWTVVGATIGVGSGAMFDTGLRKQSTKHLYAGVMLGLGLFWGCVSSFVLSHPAPAWIHGVNAAPYLLLSAFAVAQNSAGRWLWFVSIPTLIFSVGLNFFVYLFWLDDSVQHAALHSRFNQVERLHGGMIESDAWFILIWPFVGVGVAIVSAAILTFVQRRSGNTTGSSNA